MWCLSKKPAVKQHLLSQLICCLHPSHLPALMTSISFYCFSLGKHKEEAAEKVSWILLLQLHFLETLTTVQALAAVLSHWRFGGCTDGFMRMKGLAESFHCWHGAMRGKEPNCISGSKKTLPKLGACREWLFLLYSARCCQQAQDFTGAFCTSLSQTTLQVEETAVQMQSASHGPGTGSPW